jgi:dihydrofolate reductase
VSAALSHRQPLARTVERAWQSQPMLRDRADTGLPNRDNARMRLSLVAALDRHFAIGRAGHMPGQLPDDLRRFRQLTLGKPVLMGRKTALAIGRPLPGRRNLVLTRRGVAPFAGQVAVASVAVAIDAARGADLMVIGGGEVYALTLPLATDLNLTWIDTVAEKPDAFFPRFDPAGWLETARAQHASDAKHEYSFTFVDYVRRA